MLERYAEAYPRSLRDDLRFSIPGSIKISSSVGKGNAFGMLSIFSLGMSNVATISSF